MKVDRPMIRMVTRNVYLRPIMSPRRPKKMAPNGRTMKPAAKRQQRKDEGRTRIQATEELLAMMAASEPYR